MKRSDLLLRLFVHRDAFRSRPTAYLIALWWRLRGKRLRSRYQFARLLGGTSRAYDLWRIWHEGGERSDAKKGITPQIVALVDATTGEQSAVTETLLSLAAEGIRALPVHANDMAAFADVAMKIGGEEVWPWLMLLVAGDLLATGAGNAYRAALADTDACLAYADDDVLDAFGRRTVPHFKPDWNSELFNHFDYLTGACVLRANRDEFLSLAANRDWMQRLVVQKASEHIPLHVRKILHHRRRRPMPSVPAAAHHVRSLPPVTIIVPTRNRVDLLRTCLGGVAATDYPKVEVIIVDNDSDDAATLEYLAGLDPASHHVLRHAGDFNFSAINNRAAAEARGTLLCLLNNDIEVIDSSWLQTMAVQAMRDDVGAVGAQLLYPDGRIQHAGVVIGMGNAAGHAHRLLRPGDEGYFRRHALPQFVSAVTAACLVVSRERFLAIGGFDERNFAVAFNDVDLCLRLNQRGWQSLYEPRATLIHHESVSRGWDRDPVGARRFEGELAALKRLWSTDVGIDPYHHPELSRASEHFVVRL